MDWGTRNKKLTEKGFAADDWQKYYHRHQQEYKRKRLRAIKMYYEGKKRETIAQELSVTYKTLSGYLDIYIESGLEGLTKSITKPRSKKMNSSQMGQLRQIVLQQSPQAYLKKEISGH